MTHLLIVGFDMNLIHYVVKQHQHKVLEGKRESDDGREFLLCIKNCKCSFHTFGIYQGFVQDFMQCCFYYDVLVQLMNFSELYKNLDEN